MMDSVFTLYHLPTELKYLAAVESELKATAVSRVGAVGPWQLMASTARDLSLKVKGKYDERTNYSKSTVAAAKYLRICIINSGIGCLLSLLTTAAPVKF
jgi:membrane-bound lytic murein transglycosylase D